MINWINKEKSLEEYWYIVSGLLIWAITFDEVDVRMKWNQDIFRMRSKILDIDWILGKG